MASPKFLNQHFFDWTKKNIFHYITGAFMYFWSISLTGQLANSQICMISFILLFWILCFFLGHCFVLGENCTASQWARIRSWQNSRFWLWWRQMMVSYPNRTARWVLFYFWSYKIFFWFLEKKYFLSFFKKNPYFT